MPQLPVIPIILHEIFSLNNDDAFVKNFRVSLVLIFFSSFFKLLTTASDAPLLNASFTNKFPSFFLPLIAKKTSFRLTSFELIDALRIFIFEEI